jgi:hypothetical protein
MKRERTVLVYECKDECPSALQFMAVSFKGHGATLNLNVVTFTRGETEEEVMQKAEAFWADVDSKKKPKVADAEQ